MRLRICALASVVCALALVPATADARPTLLSPLLQPVLQPLQPLDRQLLDLDGDRGGTLEELLLESCDPLFNRDTDNGGVGDGDEIDNGTDCTNPLDDFPPDNDQDNDGFPVPADCNDSDATINPGVLDPPDPDAIDANCDGFDGDPAQGVFVALTGDDANPGTRTAPKRTVQAAIDTAFAQNKDVFLDSAIFADDNPSGVALRDGVNLYGGYRSIDNWERRNIIGATRIEGAPQAATANAVTAELQLLELRGAPDVNKTAYGLRAINGSNITVRRARIRALDGVAGARGANGPNGAIGRAGESGGTGDEDGGNGGGGAGGVGAGSNGGAGGAGGAEGENPGQGGGTGSGTGGGAGGPGGPTFGCGDGVGGGGDDGGPGQNGAGGSNGNNGTGASNSLSGAGAFWSASIAGDGTNGANGAGGGGGGGGGGQGGTLCDDGGGAGGGGGGAGGERGVGGARGSAGGASFAIYLVNSTLTLADGSFAISGDGGAGGQGGQGGQGGVGGEGGAGGVTTDGGLFQGVDGETGLGGKGGNGGNGGNGGAGGGGAGGPSAAIGSFGSSTANVANSTLTHGVGGVGGSSPAGGSSNGAAGQSADVLP